MSHSMSALSSEVKALFAGIVCALVGTVVQDTYPFLRQWRNALPMKVRSFGGTNMIEEFALSAMKSAKGHRRKLAPT
jgi:hypothetical protein